MNERRNFNLKRKINLFPELSKYHFSIYFFSFVVFIRYSNAMLSSEKHSGCDINYEGEKREYTNQIEIIRLEYQV